MSGLRKEGTKIDEVAFKTVIKSNKETINEGKIYKLIGDHGKINKFKKIK